jgi:hypothetical protein
MYIIQNKNMQIVSTNAQIVLIYFLSKRTLTFKTKISKKVLQKSKYNKILHYPINNSKEKTERKDAVPRNNMKKSNKNTSLLANIK